jgi:hypothetical protein
LVMVLVFSLFYLKDKLCTYFNREAEQVQDTPSITVTRDDRVQDIPSSNMTGDDRVR